MMSAMIPMSSSECSSRSYCCQKETLKRRRSKEPSSRREQGLPVPTQFQSVALAAGEPGRMGKAAPVSTGFAWLYTYLRSQRAFVMTAMVVERGGGRRHHLGNSVIRILLNALVRLSVARVWFCIAAPFDAHW